MDVVYAATQTTVACEGQRVLLRPGEAWRADDPVVKRYPDLFTDQPLAVRVTTNQQGWAANDAGVDEAPDEPPVETARQAPGEKRVAKRAGKRASAPRRPGG